MKKNLKIGLLALGAFLMVSATLKQKYGVETPPAPILFSDSTKIDPNTGLIVGQGLDLVTAHCTGCHSSKLITQFHTDRQGWLDKIRLMQQKHKLWDLGEAEPKILDYLEKNYAATEKTNRRAALKNIDWYKLKTKK